MKKMMMALFMALCLVFSAICGYAEEMPESTSITLIPDGGIMMVDGGEEGTHEAALMAATIEAGQTFGEALELDSILSLSRGEDEVFAGWMVYDVFEAEYADSCGEEDFCFEIMEDTHMILTAYAYSDMILSNEELAEYMCEGHDHLVVAVWMSEEEYAAYLEEASRMDPSVTLYCDEGVMVYDSAEGEYEAGFSVAMAEAGQTFGEVMELEMLLSVECEGKEFVGWTVYEVPEFENTESDIEEEGVLCYEIVEGYYMVMRDYSITYEDISTEELAALVCDYMNYVAIPSFQ